MKSRFEASSTPPSHTGNPNGWRTQVSKAGARSWGRGSDQSAQQPSLQAEGDVGSFFGGQRARIKRLKQEDENWRSATEAWELDPAETAGVLEPLGSHQGFGMYHIHWSLLAIPAPPSQKKINEKIRKN